MLVEGLERAGLLPWLVALMRSAAAESTAGAAVTAGVSIAFMCNLLNNLPEFLRVRAVAMPAALVSALLGLWLQAGPLG